MLAIFLSKPRRLSAELRSNTPALLVMSPPLKSTSTRLPFFCFILSKKLLFFVDCDLEDWLLRIALRVFLFITYKPAFKPRNSEILTFSHEKSGLCRVVFSHEILPGNVQRRYGTRLYYWWDPINESIYLALRRHLSTCNCVFIETTQKSNPMRKFEISKTSFKSILSSNTAHSRMNSYIRRIVSFENALEQIKSINL